MTAGGPRSTRGIDPKARQVAEDLARESGLSLSDWLTEFLAEEAPEDAVSQDFFNTPAQRAFLGTSDAMVTDPAHGDTPSDDVAFITRALGELSARIEAAERQSAQAIGGIDRSVRAVIERLEAAERGQTAAAARFECAVSDVRDEQARVADRLRRMEAESQGPRSVEALRSLEAALGRVAERLYEGEGRTHAAIADVRSRLDHSEAERTEPRELVEAVVSRLSERLEQAEGRTSGALHDLQASLAALDNRLQSVEGSASGSVEQRFEQLAAGLSSRVEAARAEMAERMAATADARFDRMERALSEMGEHVRAAENRSSQAIERMGRDVVEIAQSLGRRVQGVELRSAEAIEQVGGEVARIAQAMETKLGRADSAQAQALEKLGQEIARISERLSERISNSERRNAQAIDDVGEQMARITERISQRHERTSSDLADRIQQSEERTARLLEEAREKIERLSQGRRAAETTALDPGDALFADDPFPGFEVASPAATAFPPRPFRQVPEPDAEPPVVYPAAAPATSLRPRGLEAPAFDADDFTASAANTVGNLALDLSREPLFEPHEADIVPEPEPEAEVEPGEPEALLSEVPAKAAGLEDPSEPEEKRYDDIFDELDSELGLQVPSRAPSAETFQAEMEEAFEEVFEGPHEDGGALSGFGETPHFEERGPAARDGAGIAEASEALAAAAEGEPMAAEADARPAAGRPGERAGATNTRSVVERARAAARDTSTASARRAAGGSNLFAPTFGKPRKAAVVSPMSLGLLAAASVGVAFIGFTMIQTGPQAPLPKRVQDAIDLARTRVDEIKAAESDTPPAAANSAQDATPQMAVALAIKPTDGTAPTVAAAEAARSGSENLAAAYSAAVAKVEAKDKQGLEEVRRLANLGYAPAQFYLAKQYEGGSGGVKKDLAEARRWTERAAEGGYAKAMHNLGLYYFEGAGGPRNTTTAAQWFRRAADLGLVDSQFNLGRLYENGAGVSLNPAEAYKWFLVAARSGDGDSQVSANRVRGLLTAEARSAAEKSASAFRPGATSAAVTASPAVAQNDLVTAQKALSTLGYYQGPADGVASPALRLAIAAYQHDQGLPSTGATDPVTVGKLATIAR